MTSHVFATPSVFAIDVAGHGGVSRTDTTVCLTRTCGRAGGRGVLDGDPGDGRGEERVRRDHHG